MAFLVRAPASHAKIPGSRPAWSKNELWWCGPGRGCYIGAVTRTGVRFRGVNVTDVYARGVNVNLTPLTSNRGALASDARGCSLWRSLLERPPRAWESRVRDPLGTRYEFGLCGPGRGCYIYINLSMHPSINQFIHSLIHFIHKSIYPCTHPYIKLTLGVC